MHLLLGSSAADDAKLAMAAVKMTQKEKKMTQNWRWLL
jgi:hypothetical protein